MALEIGVIGGGMFGVAAGIELAEAGAEVTIYEAKDEILAAASGTNQWRLHRGYHYPRSDLTARLCKRSETKFQDLFESAVVSDHTHYYALAEESWVDPTAYEAFCDRHGLAYEWTETDLVESDRVAGVLEVAEDHVDVGALRRAAWRKLNDRGVTVELDTRIDSVDELSGYDDVVVAAYANTNELLSGYESLKRRYRFEVCELPVVRLPDRYAGTNIIVVYGPFMSVDHWGSSDLFLMGDYDHMVHAQEEGFEPTVPEEFEDLINAGVVEDPSVTNFEEFRRHGQQYIPGVGEGEYEGSMFTVRTKLAGVEDTAARPTVVEREEDVVSVFGGKLVTSVEAAETVRDHVL